MVEREEIKGVNNRGSYGEKKENLSKVRDLRGEERLRRVRFYGWGGLRRKKEETE